MGVVIHNQTLIISGETMLGPLDEKAAMVGEGLVLTLDDGGNKYPIGFLSKTTTIRETFQQRFIKK